MRIPKELNPPVLRTPPVMVQSLGGTRSKKEEEAEDEEEDEEEEEDDEEEGERKESLMGKGR